MPPPGKSSHLFLSYARDDADLVRALEQAIEVRGWSTWVDRVSIPSASEWMAEIRRGIESADGFVFVLTPSSVASRMCRVELSIAVDLSKRLLPLWPLTKTAWDDAQRQVRARVGADAVGEVPPELQKLDYIDINDFTGRDDALEALVDELLKAASRDLDWLRQHTRLQQDVKRWLDGRYAAAALLRGPLLDAAEAMLSATGKEPPLTTLQREFVEASQAERVNALTREAAQLAHRVLDLPDERVAVGVMVSLEGLAGYLHTPPLEGALRTIVSGWPQRILIRHAQYPTSATFNRDGTRVLTSSADGLVRWVDASSGAVLREMGDAGVPIAKALLTPNGAAAISAGSDGRVRAFDLETGETADFEVSDRPVHDLAISTDGTRVIAASGGELTVIDREKRTHYKLPPHPGPTTSLAFFAGSRVVTTAEDGRVRFFTLDDQQWEEFGIPDRLVNAVVVSPDAAWIAMCGSFDGVVIVDTATKAVKRRLDVPDGSGLGLALSDDATRLAVSTIWGNVLVFNPETGELVMNRKVFPTYPWAVGLNGDGSLFCAASNSGLARVGDTEREGWWQCAGHDGPVRSVAFDSTARRLLTTGADSTARIFDVGRIPGRVTLPHRNPVVTVDISPDETMVATTARDGVTRIFDVQAGSMLAEYQRRQGTLVSATFTPANELVVAFQEGTAAFVNPRSGAELRAFNSAPIEDNSELRMTLDQRWLVVWQFQKVVRVVSASDGADAAMDDDERARVVLDLETQMGVVSASGRIVRRDGQSPVIDRGGETIYLRTPRHQVVEAAFAPDGSVVVGAALNVAEVPIFDAASGELVAALRISHPSNAARFSLPGGCIIARWLGAASVVRYPTLAQLIELAQAQVCRELTPAERTEFGLAIEKSA